MPRELVATYFYRRNESVGNQAVPRVGNQRVDCRLPPGLRDLCSDCSADNDARVTLGKRNKDQYAGLALVACKAAGNELLHGSPIGGCTTGSARHQRDPYAGQAEQGQQRKKNDGLQRQNLKNRHGGKNGQQPRQQERHDGGNKNRRCRRVGRGFCQHADNLSGRIRLCSADGPYDAVLLFFGNGHHQLPEAPPPPEDPPPPENPPPPEKPPPPPEYPPPYPPELTVAFASVVKNSQRKPGETMSKMMKTNSAASRSQLPGSASSFLSSRSEGRCPHSDASVVKTVMTSSTPREIPPLKSPALKRGVMALAMMTLDRASVSVFSSP